MEKSKKQKWYVLISLLVPLLAALIILASYGSAKNYVNANYEHPCEGKNMIEDMCRSSYVFYRKLQEEVTGDNVNYMEFYVGDIAEALGSQASDYDSDELAEMERSYEMLLKERLEGSFGKVAPFFDYYVEDTTTKKVISNLVEEGEPQKDSYFYYLELIFDENGTVSVANAKSQDSSLLMKNASEYVLTNNIFLSSLVMSGYYYSLSSVEESLFQPAKDNSPRNMRVIFAMTEEMWQEYTMDIQYETSMGNMYNYYMDSGVIGYLLLAFFAVMALAFFLPLDRLREKTFSESRLYNLPVEVIICGVTILMGPIPREFVFNIIRLVSGKSTESFMNVLQCNEAWGYFFATLLHLITLYLYFFATWYAGLTLRGLREKGLKRYIKENSLIYGIFPFCKKHIVRFYHDLEHIDVTKKAGKAILKVVLINAVALSLISCLWFGGIMVTIVYSVVLYFVLKFYVSRMQKKYEILLEKIEQIANGNLNVELREDLGIFEPFKEQLYTIQSGFRSAVEEEVKSQKMKSELITNVSHDLKTPLTAIITYVNLLKDENITDAQRKEYLDTLERKSLRLKVLIEDLFEVSKATSGNVVMHYVDVDICNLIKQVQFELADKFEEAGLEVRMNLPSERVVLSLDSQRTYRLYENLFSNIVKYSLTGTRVYVQGTLTEKEIIISLKNISSTELSVEAEVLTERFVRGDASRNTEGSGLGLAIVKSFVELQGGKFIIENDGDLFKATTIFPLKR